MYHVHLCACYMGMTAPIHGVYDPDSYSSSVRFSNSLNHLSLIVSQLSITTGYYIDIHTFHYYHSPLSLGPPFRLDTASMATKSRGSGTDPPDPRRSNEGRRKPNDKPTMQKPVPKKDGSQNRTAKEPVRSEPNSRTLSRPSSRPRQSARSSVEQFYSGEEVATEQDDDDWSSLQSSGFLHRSDETSLQRSNRSPHRSDSRVSSIHSEERRRDAERVARGEPSPVISRANSTDTGSVLRRSGLSVQTTFPRQSSLLSGIIEQSPNTAGSAGVRQGREDSFTSQQSESYLESLSPTSLRRRPRTSQLESPFRSGRPLPPAGRRLSGPDSLEQAQAPSPLDTATQGWVHNPLRHRDSVQAGRERYIPPNLDIGAVGGSAFEYVESPGPDPYLGDDQPVYDDSVLDLEPSLPVRTRRLGRRRGSRERNPTMDESGDAARTMMPAVDSSDAFRDSMPQRAPAANASSRERTRAGDGNGRRSRRTDSRDQIQRRPASRSPSRSRGQFGEARAASQTGSQRRIRGSEASRVPTRADSNSPSQVRPIFEMTDRQRSEWKSKGIDPKYLYKGT